MKHVSDLRWMLQLVDHETQATEWIAQMTEMSNEIHVGEASP